MNDKQALLLSCAILALMAFLVLIGYEIGTNEIEGVRRSLQHEQKNLSHCELMRGFEEKDVAYYKRKLETIECCDSKYECWKPYEIGSKNDK